MLYRWSLLLDATLTGLRTSWNPGQADEATDADVTSARILFLTIVLGLLGLLLGAMVRQWRRQRAERHMERARLEDLLHKKGLSAQEKALLQSIVRSSGEPLHRVARLVLSFDRGVDRLLCDSAALAPEEKVLLLRRLKSLRSKLELDRVATSVPILSTRELAVGQAFLVRYAAGTGAAGRVGAGALIALDDAGLVVEMEEPAGVGAALPETGAEIDVFFLRQGDGGYRFRTRVLPELAAPDVGGRGLCLLEHPRKLSREQRRDYLRVPLCEEIRFAWIPAATLEGSPLRPLSDAPALDRAGTVVDCSGGGLRLAAPGLAIGPDDIVLLRLPFLEAPQSQELVVARAIRSYRDGTEFGFAFEDPPAAFVAALVRHVEAAHRRLRCIA